MVVYFHSEQKFLIVANRSNRGTYEVIFKYLSVFTFQTGECQFHGKYWQYLTSTYIKEGFQTLMANIKSRIEYKTSHLDTYLCTTSKGLSRNSFEKNLIFCFDGN